MTSGNSNSNKNTNTNSGGGGEKKEDQSRLRASCAKFDSYRFPQKSVRLLDHSPSVEYEQGGNNCNSLLDHSAFTHKYADELSNIAELDELLNEGRYYINVLYTYRSYSEPLPMIPADLEEDEKKRLYKKVFDILTPHINKVKGLMEFHDRMMKTFTKNLRLLVYPFERKEPLWRDLIRKLMKIVDTFFVLDVLKDMKGQLKNDFSRFKRAFSFTRAMLTNANDLMTEITDIHNFLNDPTHPNHIILWQLKNDLLAVPHREELFGILIEQSMTDIQQHHYVTPNEKHGLYRSILGAMYLVDDKTNNINVFRSRHLKIKEIRSLIRKTPILPVFMDTHTTAPMALSICDHWSRDMETNWLSKKYARIYSLINCRAAIEQQYISYTADFVTLLHTLRSKRREETMDPVLAESGFHTIVAGMKLIGDWTAKVLEQVVYKAFHPIDEARFTTLGGRNNPAKIYEQITRFNYDNDLKYAMVEIIGLIKGLANLLLSNETKIRGVLSRYIHLRVQEFAHQSIVWPLWRAFKKKKTDLQETLYNIRMVACDSTDISLLREDFQQKKERLVKQAAASHRYPNRSVFPSRTQILLIRRLMYHVFSDESEGMKGGFLKDKDLKSTERDQFVELYEILGNVDYVSQYSTTLKAASDLSGLWYREFYLNMTDCIQFPIAMSLPWMLTDFAMNTPALAPNVFFPLSIYNDCAERSVSAFHQQFLFDEIEAEVNLVFDQLMFTLYRKIFDYYKNKASKILLDQPFQRRMETIRSKLGTQMQLTFAKYSPIFQQKHINILGRSIDIQSLLTEQLNLFIRENMDAIINRYESSTITSVMEIAHLIKTLSMTVEMLRKELPGIDPFEDVLQEINEDTTLGSFRGRLFLTTYNQLFSNLLRNYLFNQLTRRFVSLERPKGSRRIDSAFLWGTRFTQVFQQRFKVTRGFFGVEHLRAIIDLLGVDSMPLLVDETVKTVAHIIIRDLSPYVEEILKALDPMKLQSAFYGVLGVYGYYDMMLKFIKSYPALREAVFTLLREAGNAICFVQMLDLVLTQESYYSHQIEAFYLGVEPAEMPAECKEQMSENSAEFQNIIYSSAAMRMNKPKMSPFVRILKETQELLSQTKKKSFANEERLLRSCIRNSMQRERFLTSNSGGWLFSATLEYLHKNLVETQLLAKWKGPPPKNGILEHENPKDFARFWSVATFIFLVPDYTPEEVEQQRKEGYVDDRSYFGDGWLWAGTTILYLTSLIHRYRLLDPTLYLDKLQRLYPTDLKPIVIKKTLFGGNKTKVDQKTEQYKPFVRALLNGWQEMEKDQDLILAILRSHFTPLAEPVTRFTPRFSN